MLEVIILVIGLRWIKGRKGFNRGHDRLVKKVFSTELILNVTRDRRLIVVVVEDHRSVLGPDIVPLLVEGGWIMSGEENFHQLLIGYDFRIKTDLKNFGITSVAPADFLVRGVRLLPAGIANGHVGHAAELLEKCLAAPKTA